MHWGTLCAHGLGLGDWLWQWREAEELGPSFSKLPVIVRGQTGVLRLLGLPIPWFAA